MRDPGTLKERITIERPTATRDATGGQSVTWAAIRSNLPARKLTEKGIETFAGAALLGKVEIAFAIRYWPGHALAQTDRFTFAGKVYDIASVVESDWRKELVLLGTAGANRG